MAKAIAPGRGANAPIGREHTGRRGRKGLSLRGQIFLALSTAVGLPVFLLAAAGVRLLDDSDVWPWLGSGPERATAILLTLSAALLGTGLLAAALLARSLSTRAAAPIRALVLRTRELDEEASRGPGSPPGTPDPELWPEAGTAARATLLVPSEVAELVAAFDRMAAGLDRSHQELRKTLAERNTALAELRASRADLELRVEQRTAEASSQAAILVAVGHAARIFFEDGWEPATPEALRCLGEAARATRVHLSEARFGGQTLRLARLYEWTADGCEAVLRNVELQGLPVEEAGPASWADRLRRGKTVLGTVRELPPEEREPFERHGTLSHLAAPIHAAGELWGILGVEDCSVERDWSPGEVEALRAAASSLGAAIARERAEEALRRSEVHFRELFEHGFGLICTHALDGEILSINPAAAETLRWTPQELVGRNLRDLLAERARSLLPEYLRRLARVGRDEGTMIVTARSGENRFWHYRNRVLTRPGSPPVVLGYALDVTEQRRMQKALAGSEARYRELFDQSLAFVCAHLLDGRILSINPAGADSLGFAAEETIGMSLVDLLLEPGREAYLEMLRRLPERGTGEGLLALRDRRGETRHFLYRHRWIGDADPPYVLAHALDVTERRRAEKAIEHLALHDPLTGCANRALFDDRLEQAIAHARRSSARGDGEDRFALVFLDLDDFKPINDTFGHEAGDEVLRQVARRLSEQARSVDTVARMGGDEFALVLPGVRNAAEAKGLADRLLAAVNRPIRHRNRDAPLTVSLGVALYPEHGETVEELLRSADAAMYKAKQEGREGARPA